jgi:hypothetical protein
VEGGTAEDEEEEDDEDEDEEEDEEGDESEVEVVGRVVVVGVRVEEIGKGLPCSSKGASLSALRFFVK